MTIAISRVTIAALAASLFLAGCGGGMPHPKSAGSAAGASAKASADAGTTVPSGWAGREEVGAAIALLNKGDPAAARKRLLNVLKHQPNDEVAASLLKQIDTDPQALLGSESFPYVTRSEDTMSSLADRFLGNPMMFYALARYNGVDAPGALAAGRSLRIPGQEKREPTRAEKPSVRTAKPAAKPAPVAAKVEPGQAAGLRAAGLEQMNRGAIDRAVSLLGRASLLDPANALIRRDLERAVRIQRAVRAKS